MSLPTFECKKIKKISNVDIFNSNNEKVIAKHENIRIKTK
jgi:hypothetical protein